MASQNSADQDFLGNEHSGMSGGYWGNDQASRRPGFGYGTPQSYWNSGNWGGYNYPGYGTNTGYWGAYGAQGNWGQNYGTGAFGQGFSNPDWAQGNWGQSNWSPAGWSQGSGNQGNWGQGYYGPVYGNPANWNVGQPGNQGYGYTGDWNQNSWGGGYGYGNQSPDQNTWQTQNYGAGYGNQGYPGAGGFGQGSFQGQGHGQGFRGVGPRNYQRSDERVREDVHDRFTDDPFLDASDINVQVQGGVVTLTGTVPDRVQKRRAEDLADSVRGVKDVHNQITISQQGQQGQVQGQTGPTATSGSQRPGSQTGQPATSGGAGSQR